MARKYYRGYDVFGGSRKRTTSGKNTSSINVDLSALNSLLDELGGAVGEAVRPAAQAGAQVLYEAVQSNIARIGVKTGNLKSSIYQVYSKANSVDKKTATYHVSWNARKAPHGHLLEYGHIMRYRTVLVKNGPRKGQWITIKKQPIPPRQVAARPFIRPAMSKFLAAQEAAAKVLMSKIDEVVK